MQLAELRRERRALAAAVQLHQTTIERFTAPERCWFVLNLSELQKGPKDPPGGRPGHLTSSASCYESLADTDIANETLPKQQSGQAATFARQSLAAAPYTWKSEGAAYVYCRVRTLPAIIRFGETFDVRSSGRRVKRLLEEAWSTVHLTHPEGLAEHMLYDGKERKTNDDPNEADRYPANAFHTYWGLKSLVAYRTRRDVDGGLPELADGLVDKQKLAHAWAVREIGEQTALIKGDAERVDPQQLAYALATDLMCDDEPLRPGTQRYDLYDSALSAFFSKQLGSGTWPLSEPLFHYPEAGNAHCYTFETLSELLRPALPREQGRAYRELFRDHLPNLIRAWRFAQRTRVALEPDAAGELMYGWSSGHHLFRPEPEAWATAEVFSFLEILRCVVGHFTGDAAAQDLEVRPPVPTDPGQAREKLADRGRTWTQDGIWTVGRRLASMFVHPRELKRADPEIRDPDSRLIGENDPRSAILFGPPGTGKTTLVKALAGTLNWRYVEVQAAAFLSEGMDRVPARADAIFEALMELDRCVVLFDEIDELIRSRGERETDPFGRFLTTSMLPKIAQLWDQRRILFFVATNHVNQADPAIRRNSRFDAALLVAPPSVTAKRDQLRRLLGHDPPPFDHDSVRRSLEMSDVEPGDKASPLGVLALLRHEQVSELANYLRDAPPEGQAEALNEALNELAKNLLQSEWRPDNGKRNPEDGAGTGDEDEDEDEDSLRDLYEVYKGYMDQQSEDRSKARYVALANSVPDGGIPGVVELERVSERLRIGRIRAESVRFSANPDGSVSLELPGENRAHDDGLLFFSRQT